MNIETILLSVASILGLILLVLAAYFLRGPFSLRSRLVVTFLALTMIPAILTMIVLWRELQPGAWRTASSGVRLSMESGLTLSRAVLSHRTALAVRAAQEAIHRLETKPDSLDAVLRGLSPQPHTAFLCQGAPGQEIILAATPGWSRAATEEFARMLLVSRRRTQPRTQRLPAPDSTEVVIGVAGPVVLERDSVFAVVAAVVPRQESEAIDTLLESYQRSQQLGFFERLHLRNAAYVLIGTGLFFLLMAIVLGTILSKSLTRPIRRLQDAFSAVAGGQLGYRVEDEFAGELGHLTASFNRMSADLQRSNEELVRATRIAAWQEVARRLAHEIKNPLTPITLSIHRLRKRLVDQDEVIVECLDTVLEETKHLERLANEFSSFARLPRANRVELDPKEVLQQVADLYAADPRLQIDIVEGPLPRIFADRDQLRQVFTNLIKNAAEAMPQGGRLSVTSQQSPTALTLDFADTGGGFAEDNRVFEPTYTTKDGGSGLGLAIVRRIVDDHGGRISAENRPEGGARLRLELPLAPP